MFDQATAKFESLGARVARDKRLDSASVLKMAIAIAEQVSALHRRGRLHGDISPSSIHFDAADQPSLDNPGPEWVFSEREHPPELLSLADLVLPCSFDSLSGRLAEAGIDEAPARIDLFSLAVSIVRACGADSIEEYLRSPRAYGLVPAMLRPLVDRSINAGPEAFSSIDEFLAAAQSAGRQAATLDRTLPGQSDTTPSQILGDSKPDTVAPATRKRSEDGSSDASADAPLRKLGHYQILELIGRGGMGDVYRAYEPALDRTVALKVLPVELARDGDFVRRFRAEAAAVAGLSHPHIVHIHFIGEDEGRHFFAMQFVAGESLATMIHRRGALPIDEAVSLVEQILAGLGAAHRQRIVHRDIKPSNILIDASDGRALIADFGLVKMLERGVEQTATGVVMGTLDYLSPEQARGKPVDGRSDLYSLGAVFFQLLTGRLPFEADSPTAMIFQHVYEPPPALCDVAPGAPRPLAAIVARLLAKSPDDRYATAGDVLADLRAFRDGAPLPSQLRSASALASGAAAKKSPATKPLRPVSGTGKTEIIAAPAFPDEPSFAAIDAELEGPSAATGWRGKLHAALHGRIGKRVGARLWGTQAPEFLKRLQNTQQQLDGAVLEYESRRDAIRDLLVEAEAVESELERQRDDWLATAAVHEEQATPSDQTQAFIAKREKAQCLEQSAELGEQLEEQREAIASMRLSLAQAEARLLQLRGQRDALNARLHAAQAQIRLTVGRTAGERRAELKAKAWRYARLGALSVVLLVAGAFLVARMTRDSGGNRGEMETEANSPDRASNAAPIVSVQSPIMRFPSPESSISVVAVDPRGELVAGIEPHSIRFWNAETGIVKYVAPIDAQVLAFSPDGQSFATGSRSVRGDLQTVKLWRSDDGVQLHAFDGQAGSIVQLAFDKKGEKLIAYDREASAIRLWQVDSGEYVKNFPVTKEARSVAIDPEHAVAVLSADAQLQRYDLTGAKIGSAQRMDNITHLAYSPDGSLLAMSDVNGHVVLRSANELTMMKELPGAHGTLRSLGFSPSGSRVVAAAAQAVHIWSVFTEQAGRELPATGASSIAFTPDGHQIVSAGERAAALLWDATLPPILVDGAAAELSIEKSHFVQLGLRGNELVVASDKNPVGLWSSTKKSRLEALPVSLGEVTTATTSPDGRYAAFANKEGRVYLYDFNTKAVAEEIDAKDANRRHGIPVVRDLAFAPDSRRLLISTEYSMMLWNVASGELTTPFQGAISAISIAISPNGQYVAAGGHSTSERTGDLRLWNLDTGAQVQRLIGQPTKINALAFSADSQQLISGGKGAAFVWSVSSGRIVRRLSLRPVDGVNDAPTSEVEAVAFLNEDRRAATGDFRCLSVWDLTTGDEVVRFYPAIAYAQQVKSLLVMPSGQLATAGEDGRIRLWSLPPGI